MLGHGEADRRTPPLVGMLAAAALAATLLLFSPGPMTTPASAARAEAPTVWLVGDSITYQYAPRVFEKRHRWWVKNLGVPGNQSWQAECRVRGYLGVAGPLPSYCADEPPAAPDPKGAPDVAVILVGTNDIALFQAYGLPRDTPRLYTTIQTHLLNTVRMLSERGTSVLVATPFVPKQRPYLSPSASKTLDYWYVQDRMREWMGAQNLETVDFMAPSLHYFSDLGVHASSKGIDFLTRRATDQIRVALQQRRRAAP